MSIIRLLARPDKVIVNNGRKSLVQRGSQCSAVAWEHMHMAFYVQPLLQLFPSDVALTRFDESFMAQQFKSRGRLDYYLFYQIEWLLSYACTPSSENGAASPNREPACTATELGQHYNMPPGII